jgi:predicted  nucleic acid-binding Zn-ribbon protein
MNNPVTQSELNQLATEIRNGFQAIEIAHEKLEQGQESIKASIFEVDKRLVAVETKIEGLDKRLSNVETSLQKIPELAEKVGEFKWWKQLIIIFSSGTVGAVVAKFLGNQNH